MKNTPIIQYLNKISEKIKKSASNQIEASKNTKLLTIIEIGSFQYQMQRSPNARNSLYLRSPTPFTPEEKTEIEELSTKLDPSILDVNLKDVHITIDDLPDYPIHWTAVLESVANPNMTIHLHAYFNVKSYTLDKFSAAIKEQSKDPIFININDIASTSILNVSKQHVLFMVEIISACLDFVKKLSQTYEDQKKIFFESSHPSRHSTVLGVATVSENITDQRKNFIKSATKLKSYTNCRFDPIIERLIQQPSSPKMSTEELHAHLLGEEDISETHSNESPPSTETAPQLSKMPPNNKKAIKKNKSTTTSTTINPDKNNTWNVIFETQASIDRLIEYIQNGNLEGVQSLYPSLFYIPEVTRAIEYLFNKMIVVLLKDDQSLLEKINAISDYFANFESNTTSAINFYTMAIREEVNREALSYDFPIAFNHKIAKTRINISLKIDFITFLFLIGNPLFDQFVMQGYSFDNKKIGIVSDTFQKLRGKEQCNVYYDGLEELNAPEDKRQLNLDLYYVYYLSFFDFMIILAHSPYFYNDDYYGYGADNILKNMQYAVLKYPSLFVTPEFSLQFSATPNTSKAKNNTPTSDQSLSTLKKSKHIKTITDNISSSNIQTFSNFQLLTISSILPYRNREIFFEQEWKNINEFLKQEITNENLKTLDHLLTLQCILIPKFPFKQKLILLSFLNPAYSFSIITKKIELSIHNSPSSKIHELIEHLIINIQKEVNQNLIEELLNNENFLSELGCWLLQFIEINEADHRFIIKFLLNIHDKMKPENENLLLPYLKYFKSISSNEIKTLIHVLSNEKQAEGTEKQSSVEEWILFDTKNNDHFIKPTPENNIQSNRPKEIKKLYINFQTHIRKIISEKQKIIENEINTLKNDHHTLTETIMENLQIIQDIYPKSKIQLENTQMQTWFKITFEDFTVPETFITFIEELSPSSSQLMLSQMFTANFGNTPSIDTIVSDNIESNNEKKLDI